ncbi:CPBP family intramembrane metalloprotease [Sulfidibacter corallicola]
MPFSLPYLGSSRSALVAVITWCILAVFASVHMMSLEGNPLWLRMVALAIFACLMGLYLGLMVEGPSQEPISWRWAPVIVFLACYGLTQGYSVLAGQWSVADALGGVAFLGIPLGLVFLGRSRPWPGWVDVAVILSLWLPYEARLHPALRLPPGSGGVQLFKLMLIVVILIIYVRLRPIPKLGAKLDLDRKEFRIALIYFAVFVVPIAIPFAMLTGFVEPGMVPRSAFEYSVRILVTLFFVALPEELLFRGLIQNQLMNRLGERPALVIASILFGLSHINNLDPPLVYLQFGALGSLPVPWAYLILATIAGLIYGRVYLKTGNLTAAAFTHTLVDVTWWTFFAGSTS